MATFKVTKVSHIPQFNASLSGALRSNVEEALNIGRNGILERLTGERSGKLYRIPGTRREYRASAPGESPASRLGGLRNSIETRMLSDDRGVIYTNNKIAPMLEKGTRKMRPRPFFRVGVLDRQTAIKAAIGKPVTVRWG